MNMNRCGLTQMRTKEESKLHKLPCTITVTYYSCHNLQQRRNKNFPFSRTVKQYPTLFSFHRFKIITIHYNTTRIIIKPINFDTLRNREEIKSDREFETTVPSIPCARTANVTLIVHGEREISIAGWSGS